MPAGALQQAFHPSVIKALVDLYRHRDLHAQQSAIIQMGQKLYYVFIANNVLNSLPLVGGIMSNSARFGKAVLKTVLIHPGGIVLKKTGWAVLLAGRKLTGYKTEEEKLRTFVQDFAHELGPTLETFSKVTQILQITVGVHSCICWLVRLATGDEGVLWGVQFNAKGMRVAFPLIPGRPALKFFVSYWSFSFILGSLVYRALTKTGLTSALFYLYGFYRGLSTMNIVEAMKQIPTVSMPDFIQEVD
uniref:Uncharacterized protein n=1 Tax=Nephroselmis olivacea TaxID=31312 RepID=Q9T3Y9_NEPOL|nr:hypothetical protein NeolCp095 [Nephroselmis olivacea]NP_050947.1 hypothetical protein NeolCp142 [Nephroselmis olivacea]AAD54871.1 unknown [Nephroselmis olivacea]AAD54918.1 unknown [Nephroselmis olivacea]